MSAITVSASNTRGRSRSRSGRSGSVQRRRMVSRSSSSLSRSSRNNLMRTWPLGGGWSQVPDPFPAKMHAILRYSTNVALNAGIGAAASYVFRANSIHDPDQSGLGHQPYGHDLYEQMFRKYRVKKAFITVQNTNRGNQTLMGVAIRATPTVVTNIEQIREVKGTRYTSLAQSNEPLKIQNSWDIKQESDPESGDLTANFGNNPGTQNYFHVWATGDSTSDPNPLEVAVDISYMVEFWEPLLQPLS